MAAASDTARRTIATIVWAVVCAALALAGYGIVLLLSMGVAACGPDHPCDLTLAQAGLTLSQLGGAVAVIVTAVVGAIRTARDRSTPIALLVGLGVVVVVSVTGAVLVRLGIG